MGRSGRHRAADPRVHRVRRPGGHWVLLALVLLTLMLALVYEGFTRHEVGPTRTPAGATAQDAGQVPEAVRTGGPVLDLAGSEPRAIELPDRTAVLTFDDGPDPRWTPRLLDVLARHDVKATFFVTGTNAIRHPDLLRRAVADGHEIGAHTYTHVDLSGVSRWRARLELSLTQAAIADAVDITTPLLRPPYSSTNAGVTDSAYAAYEAMSRAGYTIVLADTDGVDWRPRARAADIARAALPTDGGGAVILLHDGGGNRAQTIAAVEQLIPQLQRRGYELTTLADALDVDVAAAQPAASFARQAQGVALRVVDVGSSWLLTLLQWLLIPVGVLTTFRALLSVALARRHARLAPARRGEVAHLPPVSIVVPAYNEAVGIEATVRSLVASDYPGLEVVVVDDGSADGTADLVESLGLPGVVVVRRPNGGKPAALNTGIATARHDVIVMVDGDTVFEPDTVHWLVQPLRDPSVGAVSGNPKVGNRHTMLTRWQHIEYVIGQNTDRRMMDLLDCITTVPGPVGAFRREALTAVGGVSTQTLAEDTDLTMALNRAGWRVVYEERARAWTEAPSTVRALWSQRYRWSYGTMQAIWKHRAAVFARGPGSALGRRGLPYFTVFTILLPLLSPVIDIFALYGLAFLDPGRVIASWVAFMSVQLLAGVYSFHLDRERVSALWALPLQQVFYRQLLYLVVLQSLVTAVLGSRLKWHKLERTGEASVALDEARAAAV